MSTWPKFLGYHDEYRSEIVSTAHCNANGHIAILLRSNDRDLVDAGKIINGSGKYHWDGGLGPLLVALFDPGSEMYVWVRVIEQVNYKEPSPSIRYTPDCSKLVIVYNGITSQKIFSFLYLEPNTGQRIDEAVTTQCCP